MESWAGSAAGYETKFGHDLGIGYTSLLETVHASRLYASQRGMTTRRIHHSSNLKFVSTVNCMEVEMAWELG